MSIICDEKTIAKILNTQVGYVWDEVVGIYSIVVSNEDGFTLEFSISEYEEEVSLTLKKKACFYPILKLALENVKSIEASDTVITVQGKSRKVMISLRPFLSITTCSKQCDSWKHKSVQWNPTIHKESPSLCYKEYDLIELFSALPEVTNEDGETCCYLTAEEPSGFSLGLSLSPEKNTALIKLFYKHYQSPLFELLVEGVAKISTEKDTLYIYLDYPDKRIVIYFGRYFSLDVYNNFSLNLSKTD